MKNIPFQFFSALSLILVLAGGHIAFARAPTTARIVFFSLRDDNADIYTMMPDGSQQRNLTKHPSMDREPVWSPTGAHILFASDRSGILDLYLMDPNGTNVRKVFRVSAQRKHPSWSPDGKRIAYVKRQAIYIATIDGEMEEQIAKRSKSQRLAKGVDHRHGRQTDRNLPSSERNQKAINWCFSTSKRSQKKIYSPRQVRGFITHRGRPMAAKSPFLGGTRQQIPVPSTP